MQMKIKLLFAMVVFLIFARTETSAQETFPDPSPLQIIKQNFGRSSIEIAYSRPSVRRRKMIGHIVPLDSLWRTGANAATTINIKEAMEIGNQKVDSGTYALYCIPGKVKWTIILNKGIKNWGSDDYDSKLDVCRFTVEPDISSNFTENLSFQFQNVRAENCDLVLNWEKWQIVIPFRNSIRDQLRSEIEESLKNGHPTYWYAAQFYFEYDHFNEKALEMINQAIIAAEKQNMKPYWYYHYKALILKDMGKLTEAQEAAITSSEMAMKHGNRYNYIVLNQELIWSLRK
jgi:hypothetical protein